jgi:hypothetical protein
MKRITQAHLQYISSIDRHGEITAEELVADAKRPTSPLHELWDWDVQRSAERDWLRRGRDILAVYHVDVMYRQQVVSYPQYVRNPDAPARTQGMIAVPVLRTDPAASRRTIQMELTRVIQLLTGRVRSLCIALGYAADYEQFIEQPAATSVEATLLAFRASLAGDNAGPSPDADSPTTDGADATETAG